MQCGVCGVTFAVSSKPMPYVEMLFLGRMHAGSASMTRWFLRVECKHMCGVLVFSVAWVPPMAAADVHVCHVIVWYGHRNSCHMSLACSMAL